MDAIGKESSNDSSKCSLYNDDHTETSRTVIKESDKNLAHLSVKSQELIGTEQTSAIINGWLSKRQRLTIENSWKRATKSNAREQVGVQLFALILTAQPEMKHLFGLQKIPEGRLKYDPRFRRHAIVFTKSFDYIVKNIDYKEKLEQHFQALGERHTVLQGRGFDPEYWNTFKDCMKQTVSLWERNKDQKTANTWHILISFVLHNMKIGFDRANSRHPGRIPRTPHSRTVHLNGSSTRQAIDPVLFYQQFCLQRKQKSPNEGSCNLQ